MNTSFYGNFQKVVKPVSISQGKPWWYTGPSFSALAPYWEIIKDVRRGVIDENEYTALYVSHVLAKLDPRQVYQALVDQFGEDCTLLCFEDLSKRGSFCHRRIAATWLEDSLGISVPEWKPPARFRSTLSW